jgi:hypothetical protein
MATFSAVLKRKVAEAYDQALDEVAAGVPGETYREQVGYLRGLRDVIKICEELEKDMT